MTDTPEFEYPWTGLEDYLSRIGEPSIPLVGYGSLMNVDSAATTLQNNSGLPRRPVVCHGVRRLFNYRMPEKFINKYGGADPGVHVAALNTQRTGDPTDSVNGVLEWVSIEDLDRLRERENGYNLSPSNACDWWSGEAIDRQVFLLESLNGESEILPHRRYLDVCIQGARSVSERFMKTFLQNTYLADGATILSDWLANEP